MRLERYEDSFSGGDASRAGEAVGQRDLCGGKSLGRFVFENDFIRVLVVYVSFEGAQLEARGGEGTSLGGAAGSVSTGLMHATPGEMKSFRSSALRMALMARFFLTFFVSLFHREYCESYRDLLRAGVTNPRKPGESCGKTIVSCLI